MLDSRSQKWKSNFTGIYKLEGFDDRLEDFLDSLGLSGEKFGPIIRSAQVVLALRQPNPQSPEKPWSLAQFHYGRFIMVLK